MKKTMTANAPFLVIVLLLVINLAATAALFNQLHKTDQAVHYTTGEVSSTQDMIRSGR